MGELKTKITEQNVEKFLLTVTEDKKREDCYKIMNIMKDVTREDPKMWGANIVGFGKYHYKYESGREGDWFVTGFSPRKQALSLYVIAGFNRYDELMDKLGNYKTGKSCLYIKKLEDIDEEVLRELIRQSVKYVTEKYA